jgi:hypothetical protein
MAAIGGGAWRGTGDAWPSPRATDGEKGGPNQRGRKGDLMLPSASAQWATPQARDWRSGEASDETMERNARPLNDQVSHWSAPSIEQVAELSMGELPREFESTEELTPAASRVFASQSRQSPTPQTADGERGSDTMVRGNPTLGGASRTHQAQVTETAGPPTSTPTPTSRLQLNPRFVEALMGLPPGWTCVCADGSTD